MTTLERWFLAAACDAYAYAYVHNAPEWRLVAYAVIHEAIASNRTEFVAAVSMTTDILQAMVINHVER